MSIMWSERVAVRTAGKDFRAMLVDEKSPIPAAEMVGLWALWNEAVGAKAPGDVGWLAKVISRGLKSLEELRWIQASRLGMALARMKDLPTWEAEAEERWVLAIQRLKLGFPLSDGWRGEEALERLREWFNFERPLLPH